MNWISGPILSLGRVSLCTVGGNALVRDFALGHGKFVAIEMLIGLLGVSLEFREAERLQI